MQANHVILLKYGVWLARCYIITVLLNDNPQQFILMFNIAEVMHFYWCYFHHQETKTGGQVEFDGINKTYLN